MKKITIRIIALIIYLLLAVSFASSSENKIWFGRNESNPSQMIPVLLTSIGELKLNVNLSIADIWNTNLGFLTNANATQFNNVGQTLTIDSNWLTTFIQENQNNFDPNGLDIVNQTMLDNNTILRTDKDISVSEINATKINATIGHFTNITIMGMKWHYTSGSCEPVLCNTMCRNGSGYLYGNLTPC